MPAPELSTLRTALRALLRRPRLTAFAVVGLALGLGLHGAAFSILYGVLLRPLPFPDPDRLFLLYGSKASDPSSELFLSYPALRRWEQESRCFEGLGGSAVALLDVSVGGRPEVVKSALVTADFFRVLGVAPLRGRPLAGGAEHPLEVVVSFSFWRDRLGGDPGALGRSLRVGERLFTVVGVMPPGFGTPGHTQLWAPLEAAPLLYPNLPRLLEDEDARLLRVYARLRPDLSLEEARRRLAEVAHTMAAEAPRAAGARGEETVRLVSLHERAVRGVRGPLLLLEAAMVLFLLIVAFNVASLLLAQVAERSREVAVRSAMGATPGAIFGQLLAESVLLSTAGGLLGLGIAAAVLRALVAGAPRSLPFLERVGLNAPVLGVAAATALAVGVVAGLLPAVRARRFDLRSLTEGAGRGGAGGGWGAAGSLVVVETALTVALLVVACLLVRSYQKLQQVPLGFDPHGVLALGLSLPAERYPTPESLSRFYGDLFTELGGIPGVESVSASSDLPLEGASSSVKIAGGQDLALSEPQALRCLPVAPRYAETLKVRLFRGRDLELADYGPGGRHVLLNRRAAEMLWPRADPLGRTLDLASGETVQVVGMVADVHQGRLDRDPRPMMYRPVLWNNMSVLVRAAGDPRALAEAARRAVWRVDARQPVYRVQTLDDVVADAAGDRRFSASLGPLVGGFALLVGALGLFGVLSHRVSRERRNLAVRMVLGAGRRQLLRWCVGRILLLTLLGSVFGLLLARGLARLAGALLFAVRPSEPLVDLAVVLLTLATAVVASFGPARRALGLDPGQLLRSG